MTKGEVIDNLPEELPETKEEPEELGVTPSEVEEEKPTPGDMINFSKEIDYGVVDEEGNRIPCKSFVEAKILSLLLEQKGGK